MRKTLATFMALGTGLMAAAGASGQYTPPVPAPSIPPPPPSMTAPMPVPDPGAVPVPAADSQLPPSGQIDTSPSAEFNVLGKQESITPGRNGDALADAEAGKIDVQTPSPDVLEVSMTGTVAAHCFIGQHSVGIMTFQLVQEFDVTSNTAGLSQVALALEARLNGYVRSRHKGGACMRMASASITPVGWASTPLSVSFAPLCASGPGCAHAYSQEYATPPGTLMPLGRYVLVANFTIEASADGLINGHGVADFSPDDLAEGWAQENDPFKEADRGNYGFAVSLSASAPEGLASVGKGPAVQIRPLAPKVRRVGYGGRGPAPVVRSAAR